MSPSGFLLKVRLAVPVDSPLAKTDLRGQAGGIPPVICERDLLPPRKAKRRSE